MARVARHCRQQKSGRQAQGRSSVSELTIDQTPHDGHLRLWELGEEGSLPARSEHPDKLPCPSTRKTSQTLACSSPATASICPTGHCHQTRPPPMTLSFWKQRLAGGGSVWKKQARTCGVVGCLGWSPPCSQRSPGWDIREARPSGQTGRGSEMVAQARLPTCWLGAGGRAAFRGHSLSFPTVNTSLGASGWEWCRNEQREPVTPGASQPPLQQRLMGGGGDAGAAGVAGGLTSDPDGGQGLLASHHAGILARVLGLEPVDRSMSFFPTALLSREGRHRVCVYSPQYLLLLAVSACLSTWEILLDFPYPGWIRDR